MVRDLLDGMGPEETLTKTVDLSDYYTYYPLRYTLCVGDWYAYETQVKLWSEEDLEGMGYGAALQNFEDLHAYFPIPVPEGAKATVYLKTDADGNLTEYDISYEGDSRNLSVLSVEGENALYLTFQTDETESDWDFSQIPGGLGIYRIPYEMVDDVPVIHTEEIENICSLPGDGEAEQLALSQDGSQIFLLSRENGENILRVINEQTGAVEQTILLPVDSEQGIALFQVQADYLLFLQSTGDFAVVEQENDGSWQLALSGEISTNEAMGLETREDWYTVRNLFLMWFEVLSDWDGK